jgi:hypothetical protein
MGSTLLSRGILALCLLLSLSSKVFAQEDYNTWSHSQKIFINTTSGGAGISADVMNFPLLVRLTSSAFAGFSSVAAGGADIRFANAEGAALPYEIAAWGAEGADVWVKVDKVTANSSSQYITIYWGKAGAASKSSGADVFDTANGFQGVWHMEEGAGAAIKDATVNKYDGTATGASKPGDAPGVMGKAKTFDGKAARYVMTGTASSKMNFPDNGTWTLSAWANLAAAPKGGTYYNVINKSDVQYNLVCNDVGKWEVTQFSPTKRYDMVGLGVSTKAAASTWTHVLGIRNGAKQHLYLDGVIADSTIKSKTEGFAYSNTYDVGVGGQTNGGTDVFNGMIDEVRIENVARSKDWVKLTYATQKANANVITFGLASSVRSLKGIQPLFSSRATINTTGMSLFLPVTGGMSRVVISDLMGRRAASFESRGGATQSPAGLADGVHVLSISEAK